MSEQAKTEPCGEYGMGVPWYPLRKWWQSSRLFNQDVGLPPFLEPGDSQWMDVHRLQRSLAACSWPGYIPAPLFVPYISGSMHHPSQKISKEQYKWRVSLDVAHFSPSEISLSVRDGFLEVGGKHEERPDEHGFIARCFTRKYRLPAETDASKIESTLSVDGILTVEAPVPETSVPAAIIIPIKVEMEAAGEKQEKEEAPDTDPDSSKAPEAPDFLPAEADGEESPLEVHGDQAHPGSTTAGLQQHEERREQEEETHEKPAVESHPSVPADGKGTESLQDSSKHHEPLESQESPDTDTQQPEHKEPAVDGEIQVMAGSGEAAEEITQPEEPELGKSPQSEVPSQELEAPDIKQEHTE
ncbi:heat shock protein 67B1 [Siniperca chuatsi]|uniref:heat shock protein 67B1 n=1 Tax=Siniperca chuatsi TaxID=119488 RepID=UPI001CE21621|nr:heat shock protein 67B1 [Siniperca chuatsi]XP_044052901.1 heat shock protein 67B1 [Siniperca chuatsi]XP_044052902.1 heat shock protein 67B1 [Siniperca chuatsi]